MMREAGGLYVTAALLAAEAWGFIHDPWRVVLTLEEAYLIADLLSTEELQRQLLVDRWRLLEGVRRLSLQVFFRNLINAVHSFAPTATTTTHHHPPPSDRSGTRPRATWQIHQNLYLGRPLGY